MSLEEILRVLDAARREVQAMIDEKAKTKTRGPGRPRSSHVVAQEEQIRELLAEGPKTRNQLVDLLDLSEGRVYERLYWMAKRGEVGKTPDREPVWHLIVYKGKASRQKPGKI